MADITKLKGRKTEDQMFMAPESLALRERGLLKTLLGRGASAVIIAQQTDYWEAPQRKSRQVFPYPPILPEYSEDDPVPNKDYLFETNFSYPAIPFASRTLMERFPFPVYYVPTKEVEIIRTTRNAFVDRQKGRNAPIFKMQTKGKMSACPPMSPKPSPDASPQVDQTFQSPKDSDTNSTECLKKNTCLPVGGYSVWSSLTRINDTNFNRSAVVTPKIVAITAPMDSSALFHDLAYGAAGEVASIAALMAIVKSVGEYGRTKRNRLLRHPMYFAFNGQSYGFAGSGRFLEDVANFKCEQFDRATGYCRNPVASSMKFSALNSSNFTVINLGGLVSQTPRETKTNENSGDLKSVPTFFIHGHKDGNPGRTGGDAEKALRNQFGKSNLKISDGFRDAAFIDASQSFQYYRVNSDVVTVTNFEKNFTNSFYHSPYDNATLISNETREPLYNAAAAIANAVIELCFEDADPSVSPEPKLIDGFIDCLTTNWEKKNCSLAQEYLGEEYAGVYKEVKGSNYAGVFVPPDYFQEYNPSGYGKALFLQRFMAYHNRYEPSIKLENSSCSDNSDCNDTLQLRENANLVSSANFQSAYCSKRTCVLAESHLHAAFGTGLTPKNKARTEFEVVVVESASPVPSPRKESEALLTGTPAKPAWTESMWDELSVCYTIEDSKLFGGLVLGSGLATFITCLAVAYWFRPMRKTTGADYSEAPVLADPVLP